MSIEEINSIQNSKLKRLKSLSQKKYRDKEKAFCIEGQNLLNEAIKAKLEIEAIFSSNIDRLQILEHDYNISENKLYLVPEHVLNQLSEMQTAENYIAIVKKPELKISDINSQKKNLFLYCEEIQDPGNLGSIIRSAQAAGASAIFLSNNCADIYNPKTLRSSMGSIFKGDILYTELNKAIELTKSKDNLEIIGSSLEAKTSYNEAKIDKNILLLVGNEGKGLSQAAQQSCTKLIKIPMAKGIESLNVLAATSILLFEFKQWNK